MYNVSNTTTFICFFVISTLIGSSSGPSKIQILKLTMFKMHCGIQNAYIVSAWDPTMHFKHC